jgi:peptidoglycan/xylan/chitin deacetylase (PgdA/CDA1 family)
VKIVADNGHAIGNHSFSHPSFVLIKKNERRKQIRECQNAIAPYGIRIFRPPHGHQNVSSRFDVLQLRYKVITWSMASQDWATEFADRSQMLDAVDRFLERNRGKYKFVSMPEMFRFAQPQKENWYRDPDPRMLAQFQAVQNKMNRLQQ